VFELVPFVRTVPVATQSVEGHDTLHRAPTDGVKDGVRDQTEPFHKAANVSPPPFPIAMQYVVDEHEIRSRPALVAGRPVVVINFHELVFPPVHSSASGLLGALPGGRLPVPPTAMQKSVVGHDTPPRESSVWVPKR
jgi:hypothetical protein